MKIMIIYATKYGFTKDCAELLKNKISGEVSITNVMIDTIPSLNEYDTIIIGGSIYMGQIQKKLKSYCFANTDLLAKKNIALFLCCGSEENFEQNLKNAFPDVLLNKAISKECFGGEFRVDKMNFFHKFITKMALKSAEKKGKKTSTQLTENIFKLAESVNNL